MIFSRSFIKGFGSLILFLLACQISFGEKLYFPSEEEIMFNNPFRGSYPYITGCTVRLEADWTLDPVSNFDPQKVDVGDVIFVMINYLDEFFCNYHPYIPCKYILLTHNFFGVSDDPIPAKWSGYLEDEKILAWFALNPDRIHPKLHPIPIGIASAYYPHGNISIFDECIQKYKNNDKSNLVYMNFNVNTSPVHRIKVRDYFADKSFITKSENKKIEDYLMDMSKHKFVISPRGNGLDCHRTWETLLMGSFPIVQTSTLDSLFKDLPVVIIEDWSEVTPEFLDLKYKELTSADKKYNFEKLYMPYWIEQINMIKNKFKEGRE